MHSNNTKANIHLTDYLITMSYHTVCWKGHNEKKRKKSTDTTFDLGQNKEDIKKYMDF